MPRTHLRWTPGSAAVLPAPVPGGVGWVTGIASDSAVTVSWQPADGTVLSYQVMPFVTGTPQPSLAVTAPGTASFANVTGLANGTSYTFQVTALTQSGQSVSPMSGACSPLANLIFGDEFNGTVIDPAWLHKNRDGDQSNTETGYYLTGAYLDGSGHLVLPFVPSPVTNYTYNDSNPPTYQGAIVTRPYQASGVQWAYPGALAVTNQAYNTGNFTGRGFNYLYGKMQVNMTVSDITGSGGAPAGGWPAAWQLGCQCQTTTPLDPDNVAGSGGLTCAWPASGSEEIDFGQFTGGGLTAGQMVSTMTYSGGTVGPGGVAIPSNAGTTFHTYEVDWSASAISWFIDGVQTGASYTVGANIPSTPQFLLINNTVRNTVQSVITPNMVIDWVRVFHN